MNTERTYIAVSQDCHSGAWFIDGKPVVPQEPSSSMEWLIDRRDRGEHIPHMARACIAYWEGE